MGMFNFNGVKEVKVVTNSFLKDGIHEVRFKGLEKSERIQNAMEFHFEAVDGSGIYNEVIFEPRSDERTEGRFGPNASEAEQMQCKIKQIIAAIHPDLDKQIEEGTANIEAPDFNSFITILKKHLASRIDTVTKIKLIPTKSGYASTPGYIARIDKNGGIYMQNKFIGEDLTWTSKEMKDREAMKNAKPTSMPKTDELADLVDDFTTDAVPVASEDDLPF